MNRDQRELYKQTFPGMDADEVAEQLKEWFDDGGCFTACEHDSWTEPDGECHCGAPSWLRALGWI